MPVLPFTPAKVVRRPQPARSGSRKPAGGGSTGRGARKGTGLRSSRYGAYTPAPPLATPFQPGAAPAPLLGPWFLLGLGLSVLGKLIWDALNYRTKGEAGTITTGERIDFGSTTDGEIRITGTYNQPAFRLVNAAGSDGGFPIDAQTTPWNNGGLGIGVTLNPASGPTGWASSGSGSTIPSSVTFHRADGTSVTGAMGLSVYLGPAGTGPYGLMGQTTATNSVGGMTFNGAPYVPPSSPAPVVPEAVRPTAPELAAAQDPVVAAAPVEPVVPDMLPAAVPGTQPVPAPQPAPGGLPSPAPAPMQSPAPSMSPAPAPAPVPTAPRPQAVPATGPLPLPAVPQIVPTPADAVVLDGQVQGGTGLAPAPNLPAMAAELGRLERKGEMTLDRLKGLSALDDLAELLPSLLEFLATIDGGTTYTIQPPCGTKANGDPLDPIEVIVPPTVGPENATIARLDALAMLLDEHKSIRQPICKGKPAGEPVTVTAVEAEP